MKEKMLSLIKKIEENNYYYYTLGDPKISDREYDIIYDELVRLEKESGIILPNSPTRKVGGEILDHFEKHEHIVKLMSLDKSQSYEELINWDIRIRKIINDYNIENNVKINDIEYIVEYKFDGLTINLTYENGKLIQGATRGNGEIGEAILPQVQTIKNIPFEIPYKGILEVQGEGLMPISSFERYNKKAIEPLKNPRNAVAGALRNLDPKLTAKRDLIGYFYNINYIENSEVRTQEEMIEFLKNNGLPTSEYVKKVKSIENVIDEIKELEHKVKKLNVLTDGIVVKVNDIYTREILGSTNKFPRWAMAYKFESEEYTTKVLSVEWNVGRTGKVTPIALLEPVDINGVTVKRATLNNWNDIQRKNVKIGSTVWIRRSNDVIPEIMGAVEEENSENIEIEKPTLCPYCNNELYQDGVHIFCNNTFSCKPQLISRLVHFVSRDAMNIEGLSEKTIIQLFEELELKELSQIYDLKYEDLIELERFGEKKANKLLEAIEKSKKVSLERFIYSLGILNVGIKTSKQLAKEYKTLDNIENTSVEELIKLEDIGEIVAKSIVDYFKHDKFKENISKLILKGIYIEYKEKAKEKSVFTDKKVVITGTFETLGRNELKKTLEKLGGVVVNSISKNTDYLILGSKPGSKYQKALEFGVKILKEDDLKKYIL